MIDDRCDMADYCEVAEEVVDNRRTFENFWRDSIEGTREFRFEGWFFGVIVDDLNITCF